MNILYLFCLLAWLAVVSFNVAVTVYALRRLRGPGEARGELPPVSILKPLKGANEGLSANLESFFVLDYPEFELLFAVADPADPAAAVVRDLLLRYPQVKARLRVSSETRVGNPKFSTLLDVYAEAAHDVVLICDANARVAPDFLRRQVRYLTADVGIVAGLTAGHRPQGFGGYLDAVFINSFYARGTLACAMIGRVATPGIAQLFRRSVAERVGGLKIVGERLAADVHLGAAIQALGLKAVIAAEPVPQVIGPLTFVTFWRRHLRWWRVRKKFNLLVFWAELLYNGPFVCGIMGAVALANLGALAFAPVFVAHLCLWTALDLMVLARMDKDLAWAPTIGAYLLRELLGLPLWLHALVGNSATWAGHKLAIHDRGLIKR